MNMAQRLGQVSRSFWLEWHHELRRHAGDERLPPDLRTRLRERAQRALCKAAPPMPEPFPRRQLRDAAPVLLPPEMRERAMREAAALRLDVQARFVAIDVRRNPAAIGPALEWLASAGYAIVRMGHIAD